MALNNVHFFLLYFSILYVAWAQDFPLRVTMYKSNVSKVNSILEDIFVVYLSSASNSFVSGQQIKKTWLILSFYYPRSYLPTIQFLM